MDSKKLAYIYIFIYFFAFALMLASISTFKVDITKYSNHVFDWVYIVTNRYKKFQLLMFVMSTTMLALFACVSAYLVFFKEKLLEKFEATKEHLFYHFVNAAVFSFFTLVYQGKPMVVILFIFWLLSFSVFYFSFFFSRFNSLRNSLVSNQKKVTLVITGLLFSHFYQPIISGNFVFPDEYLNLDSNFMNKSFIEQLNKKFGLEIWPKYEFSSKEELPNILKLKDDSAKNSKIARGINSIYYDSFLNSLVIFDKPTQGVLSHLGEEFSDSVKESILSFGESIDFSSEAIKRKQVKPDGDLMTQLVQQIYSRQFIHHHNFVFGTINKLDQGKSWRDIFFQYGYGMSFVIQKVSKIFSKKFLIQDYFRIWGLSFIAYFLIFNIFIYLFFKDIYFCIKSNLIVILFTSFYDYDLIFLGPGLSPLRKFLDIIIFYNFYQLLKRDRPYKWATLLILNILMLFLNADFGLPVALSVYSILTLNALFNKNMKINYKAIGLSIFSLLLIIVEWKIIRQGNDSVVNYYLDGFFSPSIDAVHIAYIFLFLLAALTINFYYYLNGGDRNKSLLILSLTAYSSQIFLYVLWGGHISHVINVVTVFVLLFISLLNVIEENKSYKAYLRSGGIVLVAILVGYNYIDYIENRHRYNRYQKKFETYELNVNGHKLKTKFDPEPIVSSVKLIEKYNKSNRFLMISRFDNIIPILVNKYVDLPSNELSTYMMSPEEYSKAYRAISSTDLDYLFTDADIQKSSLGEILLPNNPAYGHLVMESLMKNDRNNLMKELFKELSSHYEFVETKGLLTVWKKIRKGQK